MTFNRPLLVITENQLKCQTELNQAINAAIRLTTPQKTLDILYDKTPETLSDLVSTIVTLYDTSRHYNDKELDINVLFGSNYQKLDSEWDIILSSSASTTVSISEIPVQQLQLVDTGYFSPLVISQVELSSTTTHEQYTSVAIGGTFDHLHDGHKILLTAAMFLTSKNLIIGITGEELLKNKNYAEYLESFDLRKEKVLKFMEVINSEIMPDIYEINDVCGPTATVKDIQGLVLSSETLSGGDYVNNVRKEKGFPELVVHEICVVGGGSKDDGFKNKISSTQFRKLEFEKHNKQ